MNIFLNDLKLIIDKYQNSNSNEEKKLYYKDYTVLRELLLTYLDSDTSIPYINKIEEYDKELDKEKEDINKEIYLNRELLSNIYSKILDKISSFNMEEDYYQEVNNELFIDFFKSFDNMDTLYQELLNNNGLQINEDYTVPTTLNFESINKNYILLPPNKEIESLPHEMGHIYQNQLVRKDNYFIEEFLSILMELLFMDYYSNINYEVSSIMKNKFLYNLFFLLLNTSSQLELMNRYPDAFTNMNLKEEYRVEFNSINLFSSNNSKEELYLHYYGIGFILAIDYYYKYKENNDFNEIKNFIINYKDKSLDELLNNIDINLIDRFMNEYFNNTKKVSK